MSICPPHIILTLENHDRCISDGTSKTFDPVQDIRDKYTAACVECGVIPVSYFIRNLPHIRINLAHHGVGDMGMKAIAISLMVCKLSLFAHINFEQIRTYTFSCKFARTNFCTNAK